MNEPKPSKKIERDAHLRWVPVTEIKYPTLAQREKINQGWVDHLVVNFDPEKFGYPYLNHRDGAYYCTDGMHRVECLRRMGWDDQKVECWVKTGMTEEEEAEEFLSLNDRLTVNAYDKFRVGVHAGREIENDIDRIVRLQGLRVSRAKDEGSVGAVGTLRKIYGRSGGATLGRTLRIVRDAYGTPGLEASVLDGLGLLCGRYNGLLDDGKTIKQLAGVAGGVNGLLGRAEQTRKATGNLRNHCVAAAAVEIINRGRGGTKLPSWWKTDEA